MVQYYTLKEAAEKLRIDPDRLKEMARTNQIRAFQDRGTLRFRAQEIDELARVRGMTSDPELQLGEALPSPRPSKLAHEKPLLLDADDSDEAPIGLQPPPSSEKSGRSSAGGASGRKTGVRKTGMRSPVPSSSDSDVRLVADGSDLDFRIEMDSGVNLAKSPPPSRPPSSKSKLGPMVDNADSGVRIVPLDQASDSDVKIVQDTPAGSVKPVTKLPGGGKKPSDSVVRLEGYVPPTRSGRPKTGEDAHVTEEIDIDAESSRIEELAKTRPTKSRVKPRPSGKSGALPTSSPFELSQEDIELDNPNSSSKRGSRSSKLNLPTEDSSSDFDLSPIGDSEQSPLELGIDEIPIPLADDEDEVSLGELTGVAGGSGINLREPVDSGISLEEEGSDEVNFELSLDEGSTPSPGSSQGGDSSNEFELSLQDDELVPTEEGSDSEFELSLDDSSLLEPDAEAGSDSEFELTLDPDVEDVVDEEKDIFAQTDFDVPALEDDESGSEAMLLEDGDTDLESSEFDIALDEDDLSSEEDSGSQVVALEDEEEVDEAEATIARPRKAAKGRRAVADDEEGEEVEEFDIDDLEDGDELEEEVETGRRGTAAAVQAGPAPWGPLPALVMLPCAVILFIVTLMQYELIQGMYGYHRPPRIAGMVLDPIARMFDETIPKE